MRRVHQPRRCTALRRRRLRERLCGLLRTLRLSLGMSRGQEEATAQQIQVCPAKHLPLDQLQAVNVSFNRAI